MSCTNTIVGLRKSTRTVLASNGLRISPSGVIINHKANRISKVYQDQVLFASTFPDVADEQVRLALGAELADSGGDLRRALRVLAGRLASLGVVREHVGEFVVGSRTLLAIVDQSGNLFEPDEGLAAVGSAALIATGAAKALLMFSEFDIEQIARESLLLTASVSNFANDQIFLEVI
jgi:ATP-dependent HslUV protease subunit HslV